MTSLADDIETAIRSAVTGLRDHGYSWADIGSRLGVTRQAAQQHWGPSHSHRRDDPSHPRPGWSGVGRIRRRHRGSITWAGFLAAERQLTATGCCQHPVRLRGRIDAIDLATGELAPVYDTARRARRRADDRVREPPRNRLPSLLSRSTSATPASSSAPDCPAARASRRPSPLIRACSPPSPPPRSAQSTPAASAARPCCPADRDATTSSAAARTAATSPARAATPTTTPCSAARCVPTATTTPPPCCSTPTPGNCGAGSPPTCPATSPGSPA